MIPPFHPSPHESYRFKVTAVPPLAQFPLQSNGAAANVHDPSSAVAEAS
jgi:hypothetical protein